ncbi:hypothetical protein DOTSEDRAFT_73513 [Dothistroma septosporum NZE10]|uniref:Uncharacterized protein n=1 Tax=Dothistroma septosporum (strain NZE10 / CBS 128990) TaxID=675120 RepID=N1PKV6_DOTSN|nr:hypothetical protein DOTSEDRAFT_73513 [Dothistroma septosporum NZE10]
MAAHFGGSRIVELPNGACGFRDLSAGGKAPICGCKRFWLNNQIREPAVCWCQHHACFHDNIVNPFTPKETVQCVQSANLYPTQPADVTTQTGVQPAPTWSELIATPAGSGNGITNVGRPDAAGLGIVDTSQRSSQAQSINTKLWQALNGFARQQDNVGESGNTTRLPSTAVPSVCDEPRRASPTRELRARMQQIRPMAPPVNIPAATINLNRTDEYSATEVATPSVRGTPDFRGVAPMPRAASTPTRGTMARPPGPIAASTTSRHDHAVPTGGSQHTQLLATSMGPSLSIQEMCNTILDYGRRINVLESMSFQTMPSEQLQDRFDLQDGRLLDLEHWRVEQDRFQEADETHERLDAVDGRVGELETWRQEQDQSKTSQETEESDKPTSREKRRLLSMETGSFASDASFDEHAAAQTEAVVLATLAATAETGPRIDTLESRVLSLESAALPTTARPWHVQVVLLPFGRQLPGIWFSASESTRHSIRSATQALDEWSGSRPASGSSFISTASSGAWTTESIEAWARQTQNQWLSPKACGPSGTVFQRLASRGLVRDMTLQSPDARHICSTLSTTFGDVLNPEKNIPDPAATYQGLQERLIPLRKVKKSTRLRFLSSAEMVTSTSWTAEFLESSVFMKINDGERRLYLTTPEAYTQPSQPGWSWLALKDLPACDLPGDSHPVQTIDSLIEACWTYNDRLDHAISVHSSFEDQQESPWGITADGDAVAGADKHVSASSPAVPRPSQLRSSSLPSATPPRSVAINVSSKRRVASFELEPVANTVESSPEYFSKRQRTSTSPELERRGVNFTPRWSPAEDFVPGRSSQAASSRARGTTPFAYPTPHSHFESRYEDGDTQVDEEIPLAHSDIVDDPEEWEGMQDAADDCEYDGAVHHGVHRNEEVIEDLYDEDNLEDGLTIHEV